MDNLEMQAMDRMDRRRQTRYTYKPENFPMLECRTGRYKVLNITRDGMKLEVCRDPDQPLRTQAAIQGYLCFSDGKKVSIQGELIWIIGDEMGIKPRKPIGDDVLKDEIEKCLFYEQDSIIG